MEEPLDPDLLAPEVLRLLAGLLPNTVLVVHDDGTMAAAIPGAAAVAGADRRRRPVATFVAGSMILGVGEVAQRIRQGLHKHKFSG